MSVSAGAQNGSRCRIDNDSYAVHAESVIQYDVILPMSYQEREGVVSVPVDGGIANTVSRIISAGWYSIGSCSGLAADHPRGLPRLPAGDICGGHFVFFGNKKIWDILKESGFLMVQHEALIQVTMSFKGENDKKIRRRWDKLARVLVSNSSLSSQPS